MPYFPHFTLDARAAPEDGRQDKIEMEIGDWVVNGENRDEIQALYSRLGAPPPLHPNTRRREDHGNAYGWLFNAPDVSEWHWKKKMRVRSQPLEIGNASGVLLRTIQPPLFSNYCVWQARRARDQFADGTAQDLGEEMPVETTATLDIQLNPTRFVRHQPVPDSLPQSLQVQQELSEAPYGERSYDNDEDNWLPQNGRLLSYVRPPRWRSHLVRLLNTVEEAFEGELREKCRVVFIPFRRTRQHYNVKKVETYWEFLSEDPLKLVHDLLRPLRSLTARRRQFRAYNVEIEGEDERDSLVIRIEYSPGEILKFYAKTNQRIRIEVSHQFVGDNSFRFPRQIDEDGTVTRRRGGHIFESSAGVLLFLDRVRERAALVINEALQHLDERMRIPTSHISAYYFLAATTNAVRDFPTVISLISQLVNRGSISAGRLAEESRNAVNALVTHGILEQPGRRRPYVVTAPYRHALQTLREQANWPLLIGATEA